MNGLTKIQLRQVKKAQELGNQLANLAKEIGVDRKFPAHIADQFRQHADQVSLTSATMLGTKGTSHHDVG